MRFSHQRISFWYGTEDAPAPRDGDIVERSGVSITVGVEPAGPANVVAIRYRIDDGTVATVRAVRGGATDRQFGEYHRAVLPDFHGGSRLAYLPVVTCAGRSAPAPDIACTFPTTCVLRGEPRPMPGRVSRAIEPSIGGSEWTPSPERFPFALDYLATIRVPLAPPETIGETPDGIRVNWFWYPREGVVKGPALQAKVCAMGGDWMTIRRDGIGVMDVRATLQTHDGAMLYVDYLGHYDLGPDGYRNFLDRRWPESAPTRTTPRFHTAHPRYTWLNRLQCLGIGVVRMQELAYTYDLYAVR